MNLLGEGKRVLELEARAIGELAHQIDENFEKTVQCLFHCRGKVIVTGMGKSGHIARKMVATLNSTGTPALFLHPAESSHGDLGVIDGRDLVFIISYGGGSQELLNIISHCARKGIPWIAMGGNPESQMAKESQHFINVKVSEEACPLGLAPTASSTASLAMADAIAMALLKLRGFREEDFAEIHPGGSLGRRLLTRVQDVMHRGAAFPLVEETTPMRQVLGAMTTKEVRGVTGVVGDRGELVGVITDGDIRRAIEKSENLMDKGAGEVMSRNPKTIHGEELAQKALFLMEQFQIQTLFVTSVSADTGSRGRPLGLVHIQDLLAAKLG